MSYSCQRGDMRAVVGIPFLAVLLLCLLSPSSSGQPIAAVGDLSEVNTSRIVNARLVALGTVTSVSADSIVISSSVHHSFGKETIRHIQTITFSVDECLEGNCGDTVIFKRLSGGPSYQDRGAIFPDSTSYFKGERVVLLLRAAPDSSGYVARLGSHKLQVTDSPEHRASVADGVLLQDIRSVLADLTQERLYERAELVVAGTVVASDGTPESNAACSSCALFEVESVLKGSPLDGLLEVKQGGNGHNDLWDPMLKKGDRRVLFLALASEQQPWAYRIIGRHHGVIPVEEMSEAFRVDATIGKSPN